MNLNMKIGPFTLAQLCRTSHRELDNTPTEKVVERLIVLVEQLVVPVTSRFGNVWISSGYRSPEVNKAIKGSKNSAHIHGCAADLHFLRAGLTPKPADVMKWLRDQKKLPIDQAIDEYSRTSNWLHLGMVKPGRTKPRRQFKVKRPGEKYKPFVVRQKLATEPSAPAPRCEDSATLID